MKHASRFLCASLVAVALTLVPSSCSHQSDLGSGADVAEVSVQRSDDTPVVSVSGTYVSRAAEARSTVQ